MTAASPPRTLLIDNDALVLLAGSGHLDKLLAVLGITHDSCRYNEPFPFVFRTNISGRLPTPVVARIERAITEIKPLALKPSAQMFEALLAEGGIDVGEAVLFGVLAENNATLLTTNDKRALRALVASPTLGRVRDAVAGRVISVESAAKRLAIDHGVAVVADGFMEVAASDTFLRVVFTAHTVANPDQCIEAIDSYIRHLAKDLGDDFLYTL